MHNPCQRSLKKNRVCQAFRLAEVTIRRGIVGESTDPLTVDTLHQSPVVQRLVQITLFQPSARESSTGSTKFWQYGGFLRRSVVGIWIAPGRWKVVATQCWDTTNVRQTWRGGNRDEQQLHVSLWSDVVQVWTARGRQGVAKGREVWESGHERTGLGDVGKRCASPERSGKTGANQLSHDPRGKLVWMRSRAICIFVRSGRSRKDEV